MSKIIILVLEGFEPTTFALQNDVYHIDTEVINIRTTPVKMLRNSIINFYNTTYATTAP